MIIKIPHISELEAVFEIFKDCRQVMENQDVFQWTESYPTVDIISDDIINEHLYGLYETGKCLGVIVLNTIQSAEYEDIICEDTNEKALIVHRLAVKPEYQNNGYAKKLMDFAEDYAIKNQFTSIRLDILIAPIIYLYNSTGSVAM